MEIISRFCQNAPFQDFSLKNFWGACPNTPTRIARLYRAHFGHHWSQHRQHIFQNSPALFFFWGKPCLDGDVNNNRPLIPIASPMSSSDVINEGALISVDEKHKKFLLIFTNYFL